MPDGRMGCPDGPDGRMPGWAGRMAGCPDGIRPGITLAQVAMSKFERRAFYMGHRKKLRRAGKNNSMLVATGLSRLNEPALTRKAA